MKKFKFYFLVGLSIVLIPIFTAIVVITASHYGGQSSKKDKNKKEVHYDTVRVKIIDTVIVKKIKYIKKKSSDSTNHE